MMPLLRRTILTIFISLVAGVHGAQALTLTRNFIGGAVGNTALQTVFNAAADMWEAAIGDNHNFTINVDFAPLTGSTLGRASFSFIPSTGRTTGATITFNNTTSWYMDSTPFDNSEFGAFTVTRQNLGGGSMEIRRRYSGGVSGFDLLGVALHEIGHTLGIHGNNFSGNPVTVTGGPFAGSVIPTYNGHLDIPQTLMYTTTDGARQLISQMDLAAACELASYSQCDYQAVSAVPEPSTWLMLGLGIAGLVVLRRRSG